eukprot:TRINITY_DN7923_c0_g1_i2.p1 TRINITY_DN7923_c0_g1~~TRINITY_DN7923_c0_g1_i2.p1  ORF type:complete len:617 (+),score=90.20 TRINITY_DN7923_c0_g1_i2:43-1893(+)
MEQSCGPPPQPVTLDLDQRSIRDLLSAQRDLVQKTLELNFLISKSLGETEGIRACVEPGRLHRGSTIKEVHFSGVISGPLSGDDVRPGFAESACSLEQNSIKEDVQFDNVTSETLRGTDVRPSCAESACPLEQNPSKQEILKSEERNPPGARTITMAAAKPRLLKRPSRCSQTSDQGLFSKTLHFGEEDLSQDATDSERSIEFGPDLSTPLLRTGQRNSVRSIKRSSMFGDTASLQSMLRTSLAKDDHNVERLCKERGFWVALTKNQIFGNATLIVIFLNTIYIAISTDCNKADVLPEAPPLFQILDNCFCGFFFFEVLARFMSFKRKVDCLKDGWFRFDFVLVALMVWETWVVSLLYVLKSATQSGGFHTSSIFRSLRLFRLLRATRVVRLLRFWPELMVLVQAMLGGMRSVAVTIFLLLLVIYVFAIVFTQLLSDQHAVDGIFDTVPKSVNTLMKTGVFPDQQDVLDKMLDLGPMYFVLFVLYLSIGVLTVMNLLIGVLCEVVTKVAQVEKEALLANDIRSRIVEACPHIGLGESETISQHELQEFLMHPHVATHLVSQNVNVQALVDYIEFLFSQRADLDIDSFIDIVLEFRGGAVATVKHIADLKKTLGKRL